MAAPVSPAARTLRELKRRGYLPEVVERFIPGARVRRDLFHIIDVLAICNTAPGVVCVHRQNGGGGVLGVQACTTGDLSKRVAKLLQAPATSVWLRNGLALEVWGWAQRGARGKRKVWALTARPIRLEDLASDGPGMEGP